MDPIMIFKSAAVLESLAKYFGLIESVSADVKRLRHEPFNSAIDFLELAKGTNDEVQQQKHVREAMIKFTEAMSLEDNENLISSYVGRAMCLYLLGEEDNAKNTFAKIHNVKLTRPQEIKAIGKGLLVPQSMGSYLAGLPGRIYDSFILLAKRREELNEHKQRALNFTIENKKL